MANLGVKFAGINMRNPFGVGSLAPFQAPGWIPERYASKMMELVEKGVGFIYTPTIQSPDEPPKGRTPTGRTIRADVKDYGIEGVWYNTDSFNILPYRKFGLKLIPILKAKLPKEVPLIVSIMGNGADVESWVNLAKDVEKAGADLIELNASCPFPGGIQEAVREKNGSVIPPQVAEELGGFLFDYIGNAPGIIGPIVKKMVEAVKVPVGVKLTPESGYPRIVGIMKVLANSGAKFVTSVNGPPGIAPSDIYNQGKSPFPKFSLNALVGGAVGGWNRFLSYRAIGAGAYFVPEIDHAGTGGIREPKHVIELMMLGAKIVEIASLYCNLKGNRAIPQFIAFLEKFLEEQGYEDVNDIIGMGTKYLGFLEPTTDWGVGKFVSNIDKTKCNQCGICATIYCFAISLDNNKIPYTNEDECSACSFCITACPTGARSLVEKT